MLCIYLIKDLKALPRALSYEKLKKFTFDSSFLINEFFGYRYVNGESFFAWPSCGMVYQGLQKVNVF